MPRKTPMTDAEKAAFAAKMQAAREKKKNNPQAAQAAVPAERVVPVPKRGRYRPAGKAPAKETPRMPSDGDLENSGAPDDSDWLL